MVQVLPKEVSFFSMAVHWNIHRNSLIFKTPSLDEEYFIVSYGGVLVPFQVIWKVKIEYPQDIYFSRIFLLRDMLDAISHIQTVNV